MLKQGNLRMMEIEADRSVEDYEARSRRNRLHELEIAESLQYVPREIEDEPFADERSFSTIISAFHKQPERIGKNGLVKL